MNLYTTVYTLQMIFILEKTPGLQKSIHFRRGYPGLSANRPFAIPLQGQACSAK